MSYPEGPRSRTARRRDSRLRRARERRRAALIALISIALIAGGIVGGWYAYDRVTEPDEPETFKVTIPEGLTEGQTAERWSEATEGNITASEFLQAAEEDYDYGFLEDAKGNLEGFLFPKTYEITDEATARQAVKLMLDQFEIETGELDWSRAQELGMTPYQVVVVASMIEKEAKVPQERPVVASVIYNRLAVPMKLQIDATVQYALGKWKSSLTYDDLQVDSPYNTYRIEGLPPAPICNPGFESIRAALYPEDTDYLYYILTSPDGKHSFTSDYEQFKQWKEQINQ